MGVQALEPPGTGLAADAAGQLRTEAPLFRVGTLGAFIRIRQPIPSKRMLFDIGIAGPIAGFLVAVPALFIGVAMSHVVRLPENTGGMLELGEPLLFKLASWVWWGWTKSTGMGAAPRPHVQTSHTPSSR